MFDTKSINTGFVNLGFAVLLERNVIIMSIKRIIALICCFALLFCLVACADSGRKEAQDEVLGVDTGVDVGSYVAQGRLDIFNSISLETRASELEELYDEEFKNDPEYEGMSDISGKTYTYKMSNSAKFYHERDAIYAIACFDDVFGFQIGVSTQKDVIATVGKAVSVQASSSELFIFPSTPDCEIIMYSFDKYDIRFYFENGYLSAVLITDSSRFTPDAQQDTNQE